MVTCCSPAPLTASERACIAGVVAGLLPQTATILRRVTTSDGAGGQSETWTAAAKNVAVRVTALGGGASGIGGGERDSEGRWEVAVAFRLTMPAGTDVRASDRVRVDSTTFEITAVRPAWGDTTMIVEAATVEP